MNLPSDISPEAAAWMRVQMTIAAARAVEPLQAEINRVDDWANGIFIALSNVLPYLLREHPELAFEVGPKWKAASEGFDRTHLHGEQSKDGESLEILEARKMLFRMLGLLGVWTDAEQRANQSGARQIRRA